MPGLPLTCQRINRNWKQLQSIFEKLETCFKKEDAIMIFSDKKQLKEFIIKGLIINNTELFLWMEGVLKIHEVQWKIKIHG